MKCFVRINRAFSSPPVHFGPFDDVEAALLWMNERNLAGNIITMNPPNADTGPFSEVWQ